MKIIKFIINMLVAGAVLFTLVASIGSAITKSPFLLTVIRSNSMYPVWERGDMILVDKVTQNDDLKTGDIVIFKSEEGSLSSKGWIAHRIIEGNKEEGFITQGDANQYTDQENGESSSIKQEWIVGRAFTLNDTPIVLPKLGYLSLWFEKFQSSPLLLPGIAILLAVIIGIEELRSGKKKSKSNKGMDLQFIYIIGGVTLSVIIGTTMLLSSQHMKLIYEVSESSSGALMGSAVGVLQKGEEVELPLVELSNSGAIPLIGVITTQDNQITTSLEKVFINKGQEIETTFKVSGKKTGAYESTIHVGLFFPLLPSVIIQFLASQSYWLALGVVSLVPGIPLILYPLINRRLRIKTIREVKRGKRKLRRIAFN
ncbi:signal peptidase I [Bacillus haimaensis]|uniref:signal peptidase I n=1 Tax=Bacillus haimaensis TaxID=3160967 RepID=UPI003AA89C96